MFNGIMNLMESLEERYNKDMFDNIIENTENEYDILLTIDNITMACSGLAFAAGGLLHFEDEDIKAILVDHNYLAMDKETKRFIIAHELGHIVKQLDKFKAGNYVRNIEDEFEADEYAMEQVGSLVAIKGLQEMKKVLAELECGEESLNEIDIRIENLMNKSMVTC